MSFQIPGGDSWSKFNQVNSSHKANSDGGGGAGGMYAHMEEPEEKFDELNLAGAKEIDESQFLEEDDFLKSIKEFFQKIWNFILKLFKK